MPDAKVSVVVAACNAASYVRQALDSIIGQTINDIEIICVDDGSTDGTLHILREYASRDRRISVLQQEEKSDGAGKARNLGMAQATGKYLCILDADDFFEPDMLEEAYRRIEETQADVVLFDAFAHDRDTGRDCRVEWVLSRSCLPKEDVFSPLQIAGNLFQTAMGSAWHGLYERHFVERNEIRFVENQHADDFGFTYLALACADRIAVLDKPLLHYRRGIGASQTNNITKWPMSGCEACLCLKAELERRGLYETYQASFAKFAFSHAMWFLENVASEEAFHELYGHLREEYLEELGISGVDNDPLEGTWEGKRRDEILCRSPGEYLWLRYRLFVHNRTDEWLQRFLPIGSRIAIYGAGAAGKRIFADLVSSGTYRVCAWVDRSFRSIGYPVQDPGSLCNAGHDGILIAIKDEETAREVKKILVEMGIPEESILWDESLWDSRDSHD